MKELEVLLNQRWVLKSENKELYYQLRDAIGDIRKYASDKLGCQVTENALMVKMEKIPVIPETFMGIQDFSSKEEYAFFCILLMFLEEKRYAGTIYFIAAYRVYFCKYAGRAGRLDRIYEPEKADQSFTLCSDTGNCQHYRWSG